MIHPSPHDRRVLTRLARLAARGAGVQLAAVALRREDGVALVVLRGERESVQACSTGDALWSSLAALEKDCVIGGEPDGSSPHLGPWLELLGAETVLVARVARSKGELLGAALLGHTGPHRWDEEAKAHLSDVAALVDTEARYRRARHRVSAEKRAVRRLAAQAAATRVLSAADSIGEALTEVLAAVGTELGWCAGGVWRRSPGEDVLRCTALWTAPDEGFEEFARASRETAFRTGEGLPGRVWQTQEPAWVPDVEQDANFPRAEAAAQSGVHGAFAFPILEGDTLYGVMDFFSRRVVEPDAQLMEMVGAVGQQVGEFVRRRMAEEAQRESEERFRAFAESASDATFTMDEQSTILQVNPAAERIFGYRREEMIGQPLTMLMPHGQRKQHRHGVERYIATRERNIPWDGVQLPGLRKDGTEVPLEISFGEYLRDGRHFFTGIARDISERVRQEAQLQRAATELEQTVLELRERTREAEQARREAEEANAAKSDFLAVVSHELRTPLNAIIGYVDLMMEGIPVHLPEPALDQLSRVQLASRHLLQLIEEVLSFSRIESGEEQVRLEEVDPEEVAAEVVELLRPMARDKGIDLRTSSAGSRTIQSDRAKLRQIVLNLVSNAVKFTEEGAVDVVVSVDEERAVVDVRDTGIGISSEHLQKIFDTFWQVEPAATRRQGGTGLGLTVSNRLAQLLGGELMVTSTPGEGSTFTLSIPMRQEAATEAR